MKIPLMPTGTDGGSPTGGNNARISLVIDAPAGNNFTGIDLATKKLAALNRHLATASSNLQELGLKKVADVSGAVKAQTSGIAGLSSAVSNLTEDFKKLGKVQQQTFADSAQTIRTAATVSYRNRSKTKLTFDAAGKATEVSTVENTAAIQRDQERKAQAAFNKTIDRKNREYARQTAQTKRNIAEETKAIEAATKEREESAKRAQAIQRGSVEVKPVIEKARVSALHAQQKETLDNAKRDAKSSEDAIKNSAKAWQLRSKIERTQEEQAVEQSVRNAKAARLRSKKSAQWNDRRSDSSLNSSLYASTQQYRQDLTDRQISVPEAKARKHQSDAAAYERASNRAHLMGEAEKAERLALRHANSLVQAAAATNKVSDDSVKASADSWNRRQKIEAAITEQQIQADARKAKAARLRREKNAAWQARRSDAELHSELFYSSRQYTGDITGLKPSAAPHQDRVNRAQAEASKYQREADAYGRASQRAHGMGETEKSEKLASLHAAALEKVAKATNLTQVETARLNESYSHIGKNMLQNIAHVTAWSASVGVLYGSLRVLKESVGALVELQYQQARLSVVMNMSQSDTATLTDDILKLAAANGQSGADAMRAATQWARLGMTKRQVAEATRVSLVAANVAETNAAEATESLSAIMVTYGLHAGQLNGVLGMLNQTSNTYNVTVGELLNGLERVSSVAKQAGLSLAETQGIIGAAAGATGQTGANIGNSLKSFIGAVSGEEGQKNLRSFGIETTSGGEVKDMTRIVNELYVAYQRMSEAERRTMIFSTVGKNQASRVTAMLDNYVKSQVLAVNSLNNLNSAGKENEVILATMKSQLQGVITEWMRFVALQGKNVAVVSSGFNGPMSESKDNKPLLKHGGPLGQSMSAISNIGKLANTGFGSVAATAGIGMMIAGLMRMALVQHQVGMATAGLAGKNNILVSTSRAVTGALHGMKTALYSAAAGMGSAMTASTAMAGGLTRAQQSLLLLKGAAATVFSPANFKMAGWMAALVILGELINRTADWAKQKTGNNSDEVISDAESMGQAAEVTSRSAEGYSIAARLFQTSRNAMAEALKKPGQSDATMSQILTQIAGLNTSLPGVEGRMKDASKSVAEFMAALETEKINALSQQYIKQAEALSEINKQVAKLQSQTDRLNATKPLGMDTDTWLKKRAELEGKLAEAKNSKVKVVSSAANQMKQDIADQFNTSVVGLRFLDQQKIVLSEISNIYKEIGANSDYSTQQDLEVHRLRVVADLNANIVKSLEEKKAAIEKAHKDVKPEEEQKRQEAVMGPLTTKREELQRALAEAQTGPLNLQDTISGADVFLRPQMVAKAKAAMLANQKEIDEAAKQLAQQSSQVEEKTSYKKVLHAIGPAKEQQLKSEAEAQAAATEAARRIGLDKERFRYTALAGTERARVEASGVGDDDFDKWSAKKKYLNDQRKAFDAKGGNATQDDKLQQLEREKMDMGMIKDAAVQQEVLQGKISQHIKDRTKEYRKQLMMMGPGEMLSQLAMQKLAPGMTGGQLLSAAPNMRKMYMDMPGNDEQTREMQRAADGFAGLKLNAEKIATEMDAVAGRIRLLLPAADNVVKPTLESLPGDLVNALSKVDKLNVNAVNMVVNQGAANPNFIGPVAGARASGGPVLKDKTYLVGENGPELVTMTGNGNVIPNSKMQSVGIPKGHDAATTVVGGADNPYSGEQKNKWMKYFYDVAKQEAMRHLPKLGGRFAGPVGMAMGAAYDIKKIGQVGSAYADTLNAVVEMQNSEVNAEGALAAGNRNISSNRFSRSLFSPSVGKEVPNSIAAGGWSNERPQREQYGADHDTNESHTRFPLEVADRKRYSKSYTPYATVLQPGRQTGRPQQAAAAAPRIPVAGNNAPVGGGTPAQGQGGGFPAVMAAASAAVATFSGAISTAAANVTLFSTALTTAMANMVPRTAFSGAPANADNPFS